MKDLVPEQITALKEWLRRKEADNFKKAVRRGLLKPCSDSIEGNVDNFGELAYSLGKKAGIQLVLDEMERLAKP